MSVWYGNRPQHVFSYHYSSVLGVVIVKLINPHVCTVSNLLYAQYLMLCGFSCFELFKFLNSALSFNNVGISAHCMLSATLLISHSAEVAKKQYHIYDITTTHGHFVYDTSSTDISSTDISSTMAFLAEIEAGVMKRIL